MPRYQPSARFKIARERKGLADLIERAERTCELETRADLAKFSCMRLTGFFEQALMTLGYELIKRLASGPPRNFSLSYLSKSFNPKADSVLEYVGKFDLNWQTELNILLETDERRQSLNALVAARNQIAHGENQGIDIQQVKEYRDTVDCVIDYLIDKFEPPPKQ